MSRSTVVGVATGRSVDRNPVLVKNASLLQNVQTGSGANLASYSVVPGFFTGGRGVQLTTHLRIEGSSRKSVAIPLHSLYAFVAFVGENLPFPQYNLKICEHCISIVLNYTA